MHTVIIRFFFFFLQCDKTVVIFYCMHHFTYQLIFLLNFMFKGSLHLLYPPVTGGGYAVSVCGPKPLWVFFMFKCLHV